MSIMQKFRGGAPVGRIDELPAVEMAAIVYFRLWCEGEATQRQILSDFNITFGAEIGNTYYGLFSEFSNVLVMNARRKLMHHGSGCQCFGGDESAIANMIAAAAVGDQHEAALLASHLVPASDAKQLIGPAEVIGLAFSQMLERFPTPLMSKSKTPHTKH
jgi:hypothetical protein